MKMIMVSDEAKIGQADELVFINPAHIVAVWSDPDDVDNGSFVRLSNGMHLKVIDEREDILRQIEGEAQ